MNAHIALDSPILERYYKYVSSHYQGGNTLYFLRGGQDFEVNENFPVKKVSGVLGIFNFFRALNKSDKIILHGLFEPKILFVLFFQPWLLKKCHWFIWGEDLYSCKYGPETVKHRVREFFKRSIIRNFGYLVTYIHEDYSLAKQWYGAKGKYLESMLYPSNVFSHRALENKAELCTNIMVGNSADPVNNHIDTFERLLQLDLTNVKIYCPLSYGCKSNAKEVAEIGSQMFGDKFFAITEFMAAEAYFSFLSEIDIVIFNHNYQQAMGNAITLLGYGKKVFMRSSVTPYSFFKNKMIQVFDINQLDLAPIADDVRHHNMMAVSNYFSYANFDVQLKKILN